MKCVLDSALVITNTKYLSL